MSEGELFWQSRQGGANQHQQCDPWRNLPSGVLGHALALLSHCAESRHVPHLGEEELVRGVILLCAESFLNWRIYWLALAWLIEETVRYGLLFWYAQLQRTTLCRIADRPPTAELQCCGLIPDLAMLSAV